jgi:hypothetical protein
LHRALSYDDVIAGFHHAALDLGADRILSWQLTQHLNIKAVDSNSTLLILVSLELLWDRSSQDRLKQSVLGLLDILPWFIHSWQRFPDDHNIVEVNISILRSWSKLREPTIKAQLVRSGVVNCIHKEVSHGAQSRDRRRTLVLGLVKDLTFRSSKSDKEYIYSNLKDVILEHCRNESSIGIVEAMSATLWNLAVEGSVGRSMAQEQDIWDTLHHLWKSSIDTERMTIHRNVSSAVGTIVATIVADADGMPAHAMLKEQSWLLPSLLEVLSNEHDMDWRRRCIRTVRCLASCEWGRSFLWEHSSSVEDFLTVLIQVMQNEIDDIDTRVQACQAMLAILNSKATDLVPLGPRLETSLLQTVADPSANDKLFLAVSQTLLAGLSHCLWKSSTCFSDSFLEKMQCTLLKNPSEANFHIVFSKILLQRINEPATKQDLSSFVCKPVLDCLKLLLEPIGPEFEQSRKNAIEIVTVLTSESCSKKLLAENEGLLTALVNFCLIANGPLKDDAKSAVLALIPEL